MNLKKTFTFFLFLFLLLFFFSNITSATEIDWPSAPLTGSRLDDNSELHDFIGYIYGWGIGLGAVAAFTMLLIAGVQYMVSSGNPKLVSSAIHKITSAGLGLLLLLTSWLILNTINSQIVSVVQLPPLWSNDMYQDRHISPEMREEPPCDHVLLFPEKNFAGGGSPFSVGEHTGNPEFLSGKAFRSMTEEEKEMIDLLGEDAFKGRVIVGDKIEGSSCLMTLYRSSAASFFRTNPCGKVLGVVSFPEQNFERAIFEADKDVSCFIIENIGEK